ncbi:MAG: hypothetical protein M1822_000388 [Bathelium mastoideum]|nr:MAG: hypothetical protein M1822_000388 [Bathelium mastoideum]
MLYHNVFTTLLIAASAAAAPWNPAHSAARGHQRQPNTRPSRTARDAATSTPVLPVQTPNTLPPLDPGLNLRVIALGVGTQNYSCEETPNWANSTPATIGARANLYDVTQLFTTNPERIGNITEQALLANDGLNNTLIGEHFFTYVGSTLTPTFDLDGHAPAYFLSAVKADSETAPKAAYEGMDGEGAVPWLLLTSDSSGLTEGLSEVYRVETAGGAQPATCADKDGPFEVPYSAEYWFYG